MDDHSITPCDKGDRKHEQQVDQYFFIKHSCHRLELLFRLLTLGELDLVPDERDELLLRVELLLL